MRISHDWWKLVLIGDDYYLIRQFTSGFVQSPNYPQPYPQNAECTWSLDAGINYTTIIRIYQFDIKPTINKACVDVVRISTGVEPGVNNLAVYCGQTSPTYIYHQTQNMYIEFYSYVTANYTGYTGFRIGYSLCKYNIIESVLNIIFAP